ncbi:MAG: hypothetical protein ACKO3M_15000 [Rubrivivax sp.]
MTPITPIPLAWALGLTLAAGSGACQTLQYIEPGVAGCPAASVPAATPTRVAAGAPVSGRLIVSCGLDQGSYTVSLGSTDPRATFAPKTFLVNFGRVVGPGTYVITFSTPGLHGVSATVTPNMGSPTPRGSFVSPDSGFEVVGR